MRYLSPICGNTTPNLAEWKFGFRNRPETPLLSSRGFMIHAQETYAQKLLSNLRSVPCWSRIGIPRGHPGVAFQEISLNMIPSKLSRVVLVSAY